MALCADSVPAGQYARTIFKTIGTSEDALKAAGVTINECDKVTAALSAVSEGSNQIGIVYASDAANEAGVEVIAEATSAELAENPLYPVALIKNTAASAAETAAAEDFLKFLQSDDAMLSYFHKKEKDGSEKIIPVVGLPGCVMHRRLPENPTWEFLPVPSPGLKNIRSGDS